MSRIEKNLNVLNLATLFTGIDAVGHGASRVYDLVNHIFACETDKFARQSFLANNIIEKKDFHEDITKFDATPYQGIVNVLAGGSPCQSFSIAGMRKGTADERGGLIYEYIRVVVSDSQMYKQAGNSMTVTVLEMIFERVQLALSGVSKSGTLMDFL